MISQVSLVPREGYNAVLCFRAPYTGNLRIYLRRGFNLNSDACSFKILHNQSKIYPVSGEWYSVNYAADKRSIYPPLLTDDYENSNSVFPEGVVVQVNAGDTIYIHAKGKSEKDVGLISYNRGFEFRYDEYEPDRYVFLSGQEQMVVDEQFKLKASTNCDTVHFASSNEDVAAVDSAGNVFAKNQGSCIISAIGDDIVADYITIRVFRKLSIECDSTVVEGDKLILNAVYSDGTPAYSVNWSVDDGSVAKITEYGVLRAVGVGDTVLSADCGLYNAQKIIRVTEGGIVNVNPNGDGSFAVSLTGSLEKLANATMYVAIREGELCKNVYISYDKIKLDKYMGKFKVQDVQFDESKEIIEIYAWDNVLSPIFNNLFKYEGK